MRSIRRTFLSLLLPAIALGGCTFAEPNPFLPDDDDDESGTSAGPDDGTTGDPTTGDPTTGESPTTGDPSDTDPTTGGDDDGPCSGACIPEPTAPDGWQGPVRLASGDGDKAPTCTGAWRDLQALGYDGIEGAAAECSCSCDSSSVQCPEAIELERRSYTGANCTAGAVLEVHTLEPGCNGISEYNANAWVLRTPEPEGECVAIAGEAVPELAFGQAHALCGPSEGATGTCDAGEACLAALPDDDAPMCIWQAGDLECPADGYTARHLFDTSYSDSRGCTECSCGALEASCEVGDLTAYPYSSMCVAGAVQVSLSDEDCAISGAGIGSVDYPLGAIPNLVGGTCDPTESVPTGALEVTGHITVCCLE